MRVNSKKLRSSSVVSKLKNKCVIYKLIVNLAIATMPKMMKISSISKRMKVNNSIILNTVMRWLHSKWLATERSNQLTNHLLDLSR